MFLSIAISFIEQNSGVIIKLKIYKFLLNLYNFLFSYTENKSLKFKINSINKINHIVLLKSYSSSIISFKRKFSGNFVDYSHIYYKRNLKIKLKVSFSETITLEDKRNSVLLHIPIRYNKPPSSGAKILAKYVLHMLFDDVLTIESITNKIKYYRECFTGSRVLKAYTNKLDVLPTNDYVFNKIQNFSKPWEYKNDKEYRTRDVLYLINNIAFKLDINEKSHIFMRNLKDKHFKHGNIEFKIVDKISDLKVKEDNSISKFFIGNMDDFVQCNFAKIEFIFSKREITTEDAKYFALVYKVKVTMLHSPGNTPWK